MSPLRAYVAASTSRTCRPMRVVFPLAVDDMAPEAVVYQRITVEANLIVCHLQQLRALFTTLQRTVVREEGWYHVHRVRPSGGSQ